IILIKNKQKKIQNVKKGQKMFIQKFYSDGLKTLVVVKNLKYPVRALVLQCWKAISYANWDLSSKDSCHCASTTCTFHYLVGTDEKLMEPMGQNWTVTKRLDGAKLDSVFRHELFDGEKLDSGP
ncbi:unnamed protein product, partial [Meganyctiphanes norvegica]